jgi:hypothetical protein
MRDDLGTETCAQPTEGLGVMGRTRSGLGQAGQRPPAPEGFLKIHLSGEDKAYLW